jgi:Ala-tRNA(Pro) deacylase
MNKQEELNQIRDEIFMSLDQLKLSYKLYSHPAVFTCEDAKKYRQQTRGSGCKNLFVRNKKGDTHYLIITGPDSRIDLKSLRKDLGASALSFASDERLCKYLRTSKGSVSPFGLIFEKTNSTIVIVDESLLSSDYLNFHPNNNKETIEIKTEDFKKFLASLEHQVVYKKIT